MVDEENLKKHSKDYEGFDEMTPQEQKAALDRTEEWISSLPESEQEEVIEKLRIASDVSKKEAESLNTLQSTVFRSLDGMEGDDADIEALYGYSENVMQLFGSWLDMEAFRFEELKEMTSHEAWVTGMLMGIRIGIMLEQEKRGSPSG